jgi:hypothetical protein
VAQEVDNDFDGKLDFRVDVYRLSELPKGSVSACSILLAGVFHLRFAYEQTPTGRSVFLPIGAALAITECLQEDTFRH